MEGGGGGHDLSQNHIWGSIDFLKITGQSLIRQYLNMHTWSLKPFIHHTNDFIQCIFDSPMSRSFIRFFSKRKEKIGYKFSVIEVI